LPISYEIQARGIPKPEAEWLLNGTPVKGSDRIKISNDGVSISCYSEKVANIYLNHKLHIVAKYYLFIYKMNIIDSGLLFIL
jgi:hypothetical protein